MSEKAVSNFKKSSSSVDFEILSIRAQFQAISFKFPEETILTVVNGEDFGGHWESKMNLNSVISVATVLMVNLQQSARIGCLKLRK